MEPFSSTNLSIRQRHEDTPLQLVPGGTMCFGKPGVPTTKNEDQQECEVFLYIFMINL